MRAHTPQGQGDGTSGSGPKRSSLGASRFRASSGSGVPRPPTFLRDSRVGSIRGPSTQSAYNIITGESAANPARPSSRQSLARDGSYPASQRATSQESSKENMAPPDAEGYEAQRRRIEELKAEVGTLRYSINTYEQEKEMARLQHETELRDVRRRAEDDFQGKQAADGERAAAERRLETLQRELDVLRGEKETREKELERRAREAQDEARLLQEQLEDLNEAKEEAARINERRAVELQGQVAAAQRTAQELEKDGQLRDDALQKGQEDLMQRDSAIAELEAEVLRLKAQTGDAATMDVIRRELTEQVTHIRKLEATNRDQLTELKHLRQVHKAVEVVEEEKRSLQRKVESAEGLDRELAEARMQRQRLEDERRSWAAYFQSEDGAAAEFDSPEALARALAQERFNAASLTERLGQVEPEVARRDTVIVSLETQLKEMRGQLERLRSSVGSPATAPGGDKARQRLERQRALAVKEVEYLRAQLRTFDEEVALQPEQFDEQKAARIRELEGLVDQYRAEVQTAHSEMSTVESSNSSPAAPPLAATRPKRPREDDAEDEQLGQLTRKTRKLQGEVSALQASRQLLEKELSVAKEQLAAAKKSSRTRVLALRSNPTSDLEAIKMSTLRALEQENRELLSQVQAQPATFPTVPLSVLNAMQREIAEHQQAAASAEKRSRRLKEVWAAKSHEFKEAVFSLLGWTVTFIPNGKMRVESVYHPSETDDHENSIVFDGERGTMKVSGGPNSAFAQRIADQIGFWVREKGCIPAFLSALTLEFYEEHTRTTKPPEE